MAEIRDAMGLPTERVRRALAAAGRAPSPHNTQPWLFRLTPWAIELHADPRRRLPATDPDGVELRVSCGAALFNLRMALAAMEVRPVVSRLVGAGIGGLLASVRNGGSRPPTPEDVDLAQAIPRRRTNRRPFTEDPVTSGQQHELVRAAHQEGSALHVVSDPTRRAELGALCARAHRLQLADPEFLAELTRWSGHRDDRPDGVAAAAGGPPPGPRDTWTSRDFTGDQRRTPSAHEGFEHEPMIAVLAAHTAGPLGDLRAGEALQRVLLTATVHGLAVSPISQLVELPAIREATRTVAGAARAPQAVLRIGYGWPVPGSPRRPEEDLLLVEPTPAEGIAFSDEAGARDSHDRWRPGCRC